MHVCCVAEPEPFSTTQRAESVWLKLCGFIETVFCIIYRIMFLLNVSLHNVAVYVSQTNYKSGKFGSFDVCAPFEAMLFLALGAVKQPRKVGKSKLPHPIQRTYDTPES